MVFHLKEMSLSFFFPVKHKHQSLRNRERKTVSKFHVLLIFAMKSIFIEVDSAKFLEINHLHENC